MSQLTIHDLYNDLYRNFREYREQEKMSAEDYSEFIKGIVTESYPYLKPYLDKGQDWWNHDDAMMARGQCSCPVLIVELNKFVNRTRKTLKRNNFDIGELQTYEDRCKVIAELDLAIAKEKNRNEAIM